MKLSLSSPLLLTLLLSLALTLSVMAAGDRRCYVCNSLVDKGCDANPVPRNYLVNCSDGRNVGPDNVVQPDAKVCWKQSQDVVGLAIIDRACGPAISDNKYNCYDRVGTKKIKVTYCVCNGDSCNSAGRIGFAWLLVLLLPVCQLALK